MPRPPQEPSTDGKKGRAPAPRVSDVPALTAPPPGSRGSPGLAQGRCSLQQGGFCGLHVHSPGTQAEGHSQAACALCPRKLRTRPH